MLAKEKFDSLTLLLPNMRLFKPVISPSVASSTEWQEKSLTVGKKKHKPSVTGTFFLCSLKSASVQGICIIKAITNCIWDLIGSDPSEIGRAMVYIEQTTRSVTTALFAGEMHARKVSTDLISLARLLFWQLKSLQIQTFCVSNL